jgi:hypothetical protein
VTSEPGAQRDHQQPSCSAAAALQKGHRQTPAQAALSEAEVARLVLAPVGTEGWQQDGTIPAWNGGLTGAAVGLTAAQGYVDPFASDQVKFTISAANAERRRTLARTLALLKVRHLQDAVYETRRRVTVYDAEGLAAKVSLRLGVNNSAVLSRPIPKNGLEAIWNHTLRYLGGGVDRNYNSFPVRANGDFYKIGVREFRIFNANLDQPQDNLLLGFLSYFTAPATLEGTVFLVHEPVDQVKQQRAAWIYNAGARRVRRAPDLNYDNINDGTEGMRTTDQFDAYNGAPDRYDWKLVGKQEVYIPYNSYKLSSKKLKYKEDIIRKNTVNSDLMRHELHRCWVVEANLKAGSKHIYGKRVFFLDEDTWTVVYEDAYDTASSCGASRSTR